MSLILLTALPTDKQNPMRIEVRDKLQKLLCTVYVDSTIETTPAMVCIYPAEMKQIITVSENFNLFFQNLILAKNTK